MLSLLLPFLLHAALPGTTIANTAHLSYRVGGLDHNLSTNEVNRTVAFTPATLEFLRYDPSGAPEMLEPTRYRDGNTTHPSPPATLPDGTTIPTASSVGMSGTGAYAPHDLVLLRLSDLDRNVDPNHQDTVDVNVTDPRTGETESLVLRETGADTGVFVGYLPLDPSAALSPDGRLQTAAGDRITASYLDNGGSNLLEAQARILANLSGLVVSKSASKTRASAGDFIRFTVRVANRTAAALAPVTLTDRLPGGFRYQNGSFRVDGSPATPSINGDELRYEIPALAPGEEVEIRYVTLVGAVARGRAVNRAWAEAPGAARSNVAEATVRIVDELGQTRGYILGEITAVGQEANGSTRMGVEGVRLYMEDGRTVVTDKEGKYHFIDISNGTHVIQIDLESIKGRYKAVPCSPDVQYAGKAYSRFVDLNHGEMHRANFCLQRLPGAGGSVTLQMRIRPRGKSELRLNLSYEGDLALSNPEVYLSLPEGVRIAKTVTPGAKPREKDGVWVVPMETPRREILLKLDPHGEPEGSIRAILYYDTPVAQDLHSEVAEVRFRRESDRPYLSMILAGKAETRSEEISTGERDDFNWTKPTRQVTMPDFTPERVDALGKKPAIVWPPKGWIPDIPATKIAILRPKGTRLALRLNGRKVDPLNYEDLFRSSDRSMQIDYYKGVDLRQGANVITAVIRDASGRVIARLSREIYVESRRPARVEYLPDYSWPIADGKHPPIIAVRFTGPSGHPLRGGLMGSFTTDGRFEPMEMLNGRGSYRIDSQGIAYIRLKPTNATGTAHLHLPLYNGNEETLEVRIRPKMRDWIVVGFAEGTVGYRILHGHARSLNEAGIKRRFYKDGRVSLFAKGAIRGKWLMTLAYDTGRKRGDRTLFDTLDPDRYYTLYGDETSQSNEAPSTRKLYLKLERNEYSLLFGDFRTALNDTELTQFDNAYTGLRADYDGARLKARLFAAQTDSLHFRDDLRGNGTRGYYRLSHSPIVEGSEEVTIEVRDRHHPERVLSRKTMTRNGDYDIDYDQGTLYFHDPVYSRDPTFNPIYIVVRYETEESGGRHYTWGGRVRYDGEGKRWHVGASYVDEDHGDGHDRLYGLDASYKITEALELRGEIARSRDRSDGKGVVGNARLLEADYSDDNLSARAWYRYQDESFGLGRLDEGLAGTRQMGVEATRRLNDRWSLRGTLFQNRRYDGDGNRSDENVFETEARYDDGNLSAALGYRHTNGDGEGTDQITAMIGRYFYERRLHLSLSHDQSLGHNNDEEYPTRTALNLDYQYDENTTLQASLERDQGVGGVRWGSRIGFVYRPDDKSEITLGRTLETGEDGTRIYDTFGLKRRFLFGEKWTLSLGYEKGLSEAGDDDDFDAANAEVSYRGERYTFRSAFGFRVGGGDRHFDLDTALATERGGDTGLGFGLNWVEDFGENRGRDVDAKFAYVYRPQGSDWIVLDRFDYKDELDRNDGETDRSSRFINHLHFDWKPTETPWEFGLQYALKYSIDTFDGERYTSWTDLVGADVTYNFDENWAFGLQGSLLHAYTAENLDYGVGVFVTRKLWTNAQLTVGYNFQGFDDEDFSELDYRYQGPYLRIRMKFDQNDLKKLIDGVLR